MTEQQAGVKPLSQKALDHGRDTSDPLDFPKAGWFDIAKRVFQKMGQQNVSILSAGVAFYSMLAIFPALAAIVTLYALVLDPADIQEHFNALSGVLPGDVSTIFNEQLTALAGREQQRLGFGLLIGVLLAVWSAHRGIDAMVRAITVAYQEDETRGFIRMNVLTYLMTLGAVMLVIVTLALMVVVPGIIAFLPLSELVSTFSSLIRWVVFFAIVMVSLGLLYRFAPPRRSPHWRWLTPGAFIATVLWLAGSAGFSLYVTLFDSYNETYGTLGAIIVLLMWFFLTSFSIVLGALVNAEMELQTARDTTVGGAQPMGERGAFVADTVGELNP